MCDVVRLFFALGASEDTDEQISKRGEQPIQYLLLEILKIADQQRCPFLFRKTQQRVPMIFLTEVREPSHAIAVECGEIDGTDLELANGFQFADQHLDRRGRSLHSGFFEPGQG